MAVLHRALIQNRQRAYVVPGIGWRMVWPVCSVGVKRMEASMPGGTVKEASNASKVLSISSVASEKEGGIMAAVVLRRSNMRDAKHATLRSGSETDVG